MEATNTLASRPDPHLERSLRVTEPVLQVDWFLYAESSYTSSIHTSTKCLPSEEDSATNRTRDGLALRRVTRGINTPTNAWLGETHSPRAVHYWAVWGLHHQVSQLFANTQAGLWGVLVEWVTKSMWARVRCDGFHLFKDAVNWLVWTSKGQILRKLKIRAFLGSFP